METPRIYVGTYRKYNEGSLFGQWLDLSDFSSKEEFYEACKELHSDEEDPEFMFQDYENIPETFVGESWISDKFWEYLEAIADVQDEEAFKLYIENLGIDFEKNDVSSIVEDFQDAYQGYFDRELDFTYDLLEQTGELEQIPQHLRYYFDYESYTRDLFINDFYMVEGHVFRNM